MPTSDGLLPAGKLPHDVLRRLLRRHTGGDDPRVLVGAGVGEDAAVIDFGATCLVAKTDPITFATDRIGWYAVHVNANDIAAMGATPRWFLATVIVPEALATEALFDDILGQIHAACDSLGVTVTGGHSEISDCVDRPLVVGQMLGEVKGDAVVRSCGLQPGDDVLLTKGLAIEATAIIARERAHDLRARGWLQVDLDRCAGYLTDPGISVVTDARVALAAGEIHAMHDPTEGGVATGLLELATASGVGLEVFAEQLVVSEDSRRLCAAFDLDPLGVISSGALLIGCAPASTPAITGALEDAGIPCARIGRTCPSDVGLHVRAANGARTDLPRFAVDEIARLFANSQD
jgi:hydrogenase expression/formation protein HypE